MEGPILIPSSNPIGIRRESYDDWAEPACDLVSDPVRSASPSSTGVAVPGFLDHFIAFPTVIFTVLLGILVLYWLLVIVGALGVPSVDVDTSLDGGLEGAGEGLGAAEGLEGVAEGAEGASEAAGLGADGVLSGLFHASRLGTVPVTVSVSLLIFWMWLSSMFGSILLRPLLGDWGSAAVSLLVILPVAFVTGLILTSLSVRPLGPLFIVHSAPSRRNLAGRIVEVRSGSVTHDFGQAELADGGAGLILSVRCPKDKRLEKGDLAVIISYDEQADAYDVDKVDWLEPGESIGRYDAKDIINKMRKAGKL